MHRVFYETYGLHVGFFSSGYLSSGVYYESDVYLLDDTDLRGYKH